MVSNRINIASIASIQTSKNQKNKYQLRDEAEIQLSRARSKDQIMNSRDRYLSIAGAGNVISEARKDSQKLALMDRYKRDLQAKNRQMQQEYNQYNMYAKKQPSATKNPYNQYIPMSQHGDRILNQESRRNDESHLYVKYKQLPPKDYRVPSGRRNGNSYHRVPSGQGHYEMKRNAS